MRYDARYAENWIRHAQFGKDIFRAKYLWPYLSSIIKTSQKDAKFLDIGCGWGEALDYIRTS
jgi:hypothetical protein